MSAFAKYAAAETFADMERLIYYTVHEFVRKYGGQFEHWIEYAGIAFMTAYHKYDPSLGMTFASYVRFVLWHHLLDVRRRAARYHARDSQEPLDELHAPPVFDRISFLDELSRDARKVVNLILATPPGLSKEIGSVKKPWMIRSVLRRHLRALGWTTERIAESFSEIRRAL